MLSEKNARALLFDLSQDIEEYAEDSVKNIIDDRNYNLLMYPPNSGFSDEEKKALEKLDNDENLKNALRKIIADSSAAVIFNMLNLLDGTGSPKYYYDDWTGVKLIDDDHRDGEKEFGDMLHDGFYEIYWEWKKIRADKGWKLDTYEE